MSITGVPSMASRPSTSRARPSTLSKLQTVTPNLGPVLAASRKDADQRPIFALARVGRAMDDLRLGEPIEVEDDLDVGVSVEAQQCLGLEVRRVEFDAGDESAPDIIEQFLHGVA